MLILALDTSGKLGSVALCRGDAASFDVIGMSVLAGGTYSAQLVPCIAELLRQAGFAKAQVDGYVVVDGPGSFTGLRVGLSTVKALCEALHKPLATVSMLEALAIMHGRDGELVTAVLDAGRSEVYLADYKITEGGATLVRDWIAKLNDFAVETASAPGRLVTTFPKAAEALGSRAELVTPLAADGIAGIGLQKLLAGEVADPSTLDANYIRRADAELYSPPKC
jgi:tRNA threonylcarbamoyladenosine biosynthesis protein TsaB